MWCHGCFTELKAASAGLACPEIEWSVLALPQALELQQ